MNFGEAIDAMKDGEKIAREGWNGKGMFVEIRRKPYIVESNESVQTSREFMHIKSVDGTYVPWTPSQTDVLAEDWEIVDQRETITLDGEEIPVEDVRKR